MDNIYATSIKLAIIFFFKHDELLAQVLEVVAPEAKEKDLSQLLKGL